MTALVTNEGGGDTSLHCEAHRMLSYQEEEDEKENLFSLCISIVVA